MIDIGYCKISFPNQIQFISNTFMEVHFSKGMEEEHICFSKPRLKKRQKVLIGLKKLLMGKKKRKKEEGSFDVTLEMVIVQ